MRDYYEDWMRLTLERIRSRDEVAALSRTKHKPITMPKQPALKPLQRVGNHYR